MPVTKSAKKKLLQDKRRQLKNKALKVNIKQAVKEVRSSLTQKSLQEATSIIDKSVKDHVFHKNKAARIKSQLAKLLAQKPTMTKTEKSPTKKTSPKQKKA